MVSCVCSSSIGTSQLFLKLTWTWNHIPSPGPTNSWCPASTFRSTAELWVVGKPMAKWILKEILLNCHGQNVPSHTLTVFAMLFFGWSLLLDYSNQLPLFFQVLGSSFTTSVHSSALWAHELDLVLWSSISYDCILQEIASGEMENSSTLEVLEWR